MHPLLQIWFCFVSVMYLLSKARAFLKVLGTLILFPTAKDIRLCSKDNKSLTAASDTPGYLEDHHKSATATSIWVTSEFSHIGSFFLMTSFSVTFAFFFVFRTIVNTFYFITCKLALVFITWNIPILKDRNYYEPFLHHFHFWNFRKKRSYEKRQCSFRYLTNWYHPNYCKLWNETNCAA